MTQQVNLYARLPKTKVKKHVVSDALLKNLSLVLLVGFVVLLLVQLASYGINSRSIDSLKKQNEDVQAALVKLNEQYPEETKQLLLQKGERMQEEFDVKGQLLELLRSQSAETTGFSQPLESLAKQITGGVWLTKIDIDLENNVFHFEGQASQVDQVLAFINNLGNDAFFSDKNFKVFEVLQVQADTGYIKFILATE